MKNANVIQEKNVKLEYINQCLNVWVNEVSGAEQQSRQRARELIFTAYTNNSDSLNLLSLNLTSLPDIIGELTNLQILFASNNHFVRVPGII